MIVELELGWAEVDVAVDVAGELILPIASPGSGFSRTSDLARRKTSGGGSAVCEWDW